MKKRNPKGQFVAKPGEIHLLRAYVNRLFGWCAGFAAVVAVLNFAFNAHDSHDAQEHRDSVSSVTSNRALNLAQQDSIRLDGIHK